MKSLFKYLGIWLLCLIMTNCASSTKTDSTTSADYKKEVEDKIGTPVTYIKNQANDKILCLNEDDNEDKSKVNRIFVVWDIESSKIVYEKNMKGGYVKWFDNDHLEMAGTIGIIQPDKTEEDYIRIVNVMSNQSMSKSNFLKTKDL